MRRVSLTLDAGAAAVVSAIGGGDVAVEGVGVAVAVSVH
eukprot:CAMPEP_0194290564 /NCGR_PEP_ID=MMETSP0169-20130528/41496_1 /TAXON_ID=218684 /ORGANISM="Corethron pennatum, Strain L29A3" /LENGTH=38 /DNA_ID= /DNA_START= /DNA_END= /DNA_ORIENTATION=